MTPRGSGARARVALISMPWPEVGRPSPALGIIQAQLAAAGVSAESLHLNVELARTIGFRLYDVLAATALLGEWLFSRAAFGADAVETPIAALEAWIHGGEASDPSARPRPELSAEWLAELREELVPRWCDRIADDLAEHAVLGFSCTFGQLVPALGLARAVKRRNPAARILLGGSQCEGTAGPELLRALPWLDAVYAGEFEVAGVETVRWASGERPAPPTEYVSHRTPDGSLSLATDVALLKDMDASPTPDYDDWFERADGVRDRFGVPLQARSLPFESARGCWWGQRRHCTFCGLNGGLMSFRSKSAERVLDEILGLASRYDRIALNAVDNIIDHRYLRTLLPRLAERDLGIELFWETKANLKRADVQVCQRAGVTRIQPGIESFSSHVLDLMSKGVSGLQNVYLLKLCRQYGVVPSYNVLFGFPGETADDQRLQAAWMGWLHHLAPPTVVSRFSLQRYSPMFRDPAGFGLVDVRPAEHYELVYPRRLVELERVAFYFDHDVEEPESAELVRAHKELRRAVRKWRRRWRSGSQEPELTSRDAGAFVLVTDGRGVGPPRRHVLRGPTRDLLVACDDPITLRKLRGRCANVESELAALAELGLVLRQGDTFLSLVIPHSKRARIPFVARPRREPASRRPNRERRRRAFAQDAPPVERAAES